MVDASPVTLAGESIAPAAITDYKIVRGAGALMDVNPLTAVLRWKGNDLVHLAREVVAGAGVPAQPGQGDAR
jgi:hypothetical protein